MTKPKLKVFDSLGTSEKATGQIPKKYEDILLKHFTKEEIANFTKDDIDSLPTENSWTFYLVLSAIIALPFLLLTFALHWAGNDPYHSEHKESSRGGRWN